MPVTATSNTYATWDNSSNTYATLEAAPTYGVLEGARLTITRTLPSAGSLGTSRARMLVVGGTLGSSGALPMQSLLRRAFAGALSAAGAVLLGKIFTRSLGGTLHPTGTLASVRQRLLPLAGALGSSGVFSFRQLLRVYIRLEGRLWPIGSLEICVRRLPVPPLEPLSPIPDVDLSLLGSGSQSAPLLVLVQGTPPSNWGPCPPPTGAPSLVPIATPGAPPLYEAPECRP